MENSENPRSITTFKRRKTQRSQMGNAVHESLASFRCSSRRMRRKRREKKAKKNFVVGLEEEEEEEEEEEGKAEVERRIMALQMIVPGGESLGIDKLFEETAGYILALQCQVKAMKVLASFFEGLEKEKMKLGG